MVRGAVLMLAVALLGAVSAARADHRALLDSLAMHHHASRPDLVDSLATPAIDVARARGDSAGLGALLLARGRTRAAFGLARQAEPDLSAALDLARSARDTQAQLRALRWLSVAIGRQGRSADATRRYGDLEVLARAAGDSVHLGWAWVGLAYGHYLSGRADSAATLYGQAGDVLGRAGIERGAVWAWNGQGLAWRQAGRFDAARSAFTRVLDAARGSGDALNEAMALNYLGRLDLHVGDPGRAEMNLRAAAAIHAAHRHHREGLLPRIDIATALVLQGRVEAAAAALDSVIAASRRYGLADLEILAVCQLADVLIEMERPAAAAAQCRAVLARSTGPSAMTETEVRLRLARALAARDSTADALAVLDVAATAGPGARMLELQVAAARGRYLLALGRPAEALAILRQPAAAESSVGAEPLRLPLITALGRAQLAVGQPDSALAAFETAVALWDAARSMPEDPVWRERRGLAAGDLFAHAVAARLEHPALVPLPLRVDAAHALLQRYKARTLIERILGPGRPLPAAHAPVPLDSLRHRVLVRGEVLLDVVQGTADGLVFCVTGDTVLVDHLPGRRTTAPRLQRLAAVLASPAVRDPRPAHDLAAGLLAGLGAPIRAVLAEARRVYWCPDGDFHRLPLALLTGPDDLLPASCEVVCLPSGRVLAELRSGAPPPPAGHGVVAVCGHEPGRDGPLPGAAAEIRRLAANLQDVRRIDADEIMRNGLDTTGAVVVHLATHVRLDARQPWQTAIDLTADPEGIIRASDVANSPCAVRLAVLSGCRTAGNSVVGGEGLLGLASGFLAAGTPAVLATLWNVDDHAAARIMAVFYDQLAGGATASGALARTREICRRRADTSAPRDWAAFVLVGDGSRPIPVRARRPLWPAALALLGAAVTIVVITRRRM